MSLLPQAPRPQAPHGHLGHLRMAPACPSCSIPPSLGTAWPLHSSGAPLPLSRAHCTAFPQPFFPDVDPILSGAFLRLHFSGWLFLGSRRRHVSDEGSMAESTSPRDSFENLPRVVTGHKSVTIRSQCTTLHSSLSHRLSICRSCRAQTPQTLGVTKKPLLSLRVRAPQCLASQPGHQQRPRPCLPWPPCLPWVLLSWDPSAGGCLHAFLAKETSAQRDGHLATLRRVTPLPIRALSQPPQSRHCPSCTAQHSFRPLNMPTAHRREHSPIPCDAYLRWGPGPLSSMFLTLL